MPNLKPFVVAGFGGLRELTMDPDRPGPTQKGCGSATLDLSLPPSFAYTLTAMISTIPIALRQYRPEAMAK